MIRTELRRICNGINAVFLWLKTSRLSAGGHKQVYLRPYHSRFTKPQRTAYSAACVRLVNPNFESTALTYLATVFS